MKRRSAVLFALCAAGCTPQVPDSAAGVGFQDYNSYVRDAYAPPPAAAPVTVVPPAAPSGAFDPVAAAAAIDRADGVTPAPLAPAPVAPVAPAAAPAAAAPVYTPPADASGARPRGNAPAGIKEESGEMAGIDHAGISDEQDFGAVSSRESIESDKERIEENRAQYVVVQPKDLPVRPGDTGPNIVEYALATTNNPGTPLYHRSGRKDSTSACARYTSPDIAQQEFLQKGGPDRDRMGLDPDGDGFACSWDPRPFRTALQ